MAASSTEINEKTMQYYLYPPPIAQYQDVIASSKVFMDTLGEFHAAMGTKFKIPIVGGKDLDLHRLFIEVTLRGGIKRVLEEKRWREVTNCFCFPPSATNASFILRKYYMSLIHHFEQVYYFKAKAWTPVPTDTWQSTNSTLTSTSGANKSLLLLPETQMSPSLEIQVGPVKRQRMTTEEDSLPKESSIGLPVTGIIDGKFESGYLCTVRIGGEQLQGVLYQTERTQVGTTDATQALTMVKHRRRRRKKSEIRKRDPAHPKPNRSGYNFFFAEHHARLKLLHTGKERGISRMIGAHWNKLTESEKAVYQEKAVKDKERYRVEMERYRAGFQRGKPEDDVVPLQQQYYTNMMFDENNGNDSENSHQNEPNSVYFDDDASSFEGEEDKVTEQEPNLGFVSDIEMGAEKVELETLAGKTGLEGDESKQNDLILFGDHKKSFDIDGSVEQKSKDEKSADDKQRMPDIKDENNTKSADKQHEDLSVNLEKDRQVFEETNHIRET